MYKSENFAFYRSYEMWQFNGNFIPNPRTRYWEIWLEAVDARLTNAVTSFVDSMKSFDMAKYITQIKKSRLK